MTHYPAVRAPQQRRFFGEDVEVTGIEFNEYAVQRLQRKYAFTVGSSSCRPWTREHRLAPARKAPRGLPSDARAPLLLSRKTLAAVLEEHGFEILQMRSIGHNLRVAFLLDRLSLYHRTFRSLRAAAVRLGVGSFPLRINLGMQMIAYARRRR